MFSKLAANWDESQSAISASPITSMDIVSMWQGRVVNNSWTSAPSGNYYVPNIEEGDLVVVVTCFEVRCWAHSWIDGNYRGSAQGITSVYNTEYANEKANLFVFNATAAEGWRQYKTTTGTSMGIGFDFSRVTPPSTSNAAGLKTNGIITIYHLRPDTPFIAGSHTITSGVQTSSLPIATRGSTTPINNFTTPSTGFNFGIISSDAYIRVSKSSTAPWAPTSLAEPYYVTDLSGPTRPSPTTAKSNLTHGNSLMPTLHNNTNLTNMMTPRPDVGWSYLYTFWSYIYMYMAFRHDTLVTPAQGSTHNMSHAFMWSSTAESLFESKYFHLNITL